MFETFRIERHIRKHDQRSKLLTSIILPSLFLGLVLPWKYFTPFLDYSVKIYENKQATSLLDSEHKEVLKQKQSLDTVTSTLEVVQEMVHEAPWENEAENLRRTFADLLHTQRKDWVNDKHVYQEAADTAVKKVAEGESRITAGANPWQGTDQHRIEKISGAPQRPPASYRQVETWPLGQIMVRQCPGES